MKYIIKAKEPKRFADWKRRANADWTSTFDNLSGDEKLAVYKALKKEQGVICCYCETRLVNNDYHIEHLIPQHLEDVDPLDFSNMLCSCQQRLIKQEPRHCGNSKNGWYDENLFISPLNSSCERKFKYTYDGHIEPATKGDEKAITTIEKLQLGIDNLNAKRRSAIFPFIDPDVPLSPSEVRKLAKNYLVGKNANKGRFNEFYTTIKYLFA